MDQEYFHSSYRILESLPLNVFFFVTFLVKSFPTIFDNMLRDLARSCSMSLILESFVSSSSDETKKRGNAGEDAESSQK